MIYITRLENKNEALLKLGYTKFDTTDNRYEPYYKIFDEVETLYTFKDETLDEKKLELTINKQVLCEYKVLPITRFSGYSECYALKDLNLLIATIEDLSTSSLFEKVDKVCETIPTRNVQKSVPILIEDTQTQFDLTKYIIEVSAKEYGLSKVDKLVLICLSNYMQKDKYGVFSAFPSQSTLGDITGMNRNTVGSSLDKMEKLGYLNAETRHDNSKVYTWLGFEANKTLEAQNFMRVCQDKAERKKELDKVRGGNSRKESSRNKEVKEVCTDFVR